MRLTELIPDNDLIQRKLQRIRSGEPIRTVDLFAGAGGFSLGFHRHGYEIIAAVEINDQARKTHEHNFGRCCPHYHSFDNITTINPPGKAVAHAVEAGLGESPAEVVDVIIGGPPCQPFSLQGRAKLADIKGEPRAFENDARVSLYEHYLNFVEDLKPVAFVMENVLGVGNFKGQNIPELIAQAVADKGYTVRYALLNAAWYGVPQMRERIIVIGVHRSVGHDPEFPGAEYLLQLPQGYVTSRTGTGKAVPLRKPHPNYREVALPQNGPSAITAQDALSDLPEITYHLRPDTKVRGVRKFGELQLYRTAAANGFASDMRSWPGFGRSDGVIDHVIRHTPRDYRIFSAMDPGAEYPAAHAIAEQLFADALLAVKRQGTALTNEAEAQLHKDYVPPYPVDKYPNKWRKMEPDTPARTLPAHLGHDAYSHIHYDKNQARTISVREAARLQSFPDGFEFPVSMVAAFRQIGNAVPPLMAAAIANCLKKVLLRHD